MSTIESRDPAVQRPEDPDAPRVSVVIPCLNEAENIEECVRRARAALDDNQITGEVLVADNGSTDGSAELAERAGALVLHEHRRGYGSAYLAGFAAARGEYIVMIDADLTYDFNDIPRFVEHLQQRLLKLWLRGEASFGRARGLLRLGLAAPPVRRAATA